MESILMTITEEPHSWSEKLEAEVSSLKEKLKAAHTAVTRTHAHMDSQKKRTKQLVAAWKVRLEEGEEKLRRHKEFLDKQLQTLVSDMLFFESALRKEQKEIRHQLNDKDLTISSQKRTIDALLASNVALTKALKKLKRKYKEATHYSANSDSVTESSRLIQREADALISQIFANNHSFLSSQSVSPFREHLPEKPEGSGNLITDEKENNDMSTSPHVFFCLTESKDESRGSSMKLVTNASSIPLSSVYASDRNQTFSIESPDPPQYIEQPNLEIPKEKPKEEDDTDPIDIFYPKEPYIKDHDIEVDTPKIHSLHNSRKIPLVSTKSCPNLGLSVIQENFQLTDINPEKPRQRSDSADLMNYDDFDIEFDPLSDNSDVFTSSYNSVTSLNSLDQGLSFDTGSPLFEEGIYESLPEVHEPGAFVGKGEGDGKDIINVSWKAKSEVEPEEEIAPDQGKWKQVKSPSRVSSFNLLKRIRRPRDVKKKQKATRTSSDGDQIKEKIDKHKRKLTL